MAMGMTGSQCKWKEKGQNGAGACLKSRGGGRCACSEQQLGSVERLATGWTRRAVATV